MDSLKSDLSKIVAPIICNVCEFGCGFEGSCDIGRDNDCFFLIETADKVVDSVFEYLNNKVRFKK